MDEKYCEKLRQLQEVIAKLVSPEGCPWDREQTALSMTEYVIEESHELVAAIRGGKPDEIRGELGDLFFLLLFIANYYEKAGSFSLADVFDSASAKMIRRHPHVFGDAHFGNLAEQLAAWEKIKKQEHAEAGDGSGLFASLPDSLPPLIKAYRIHSKAARVGFTWPTDEEAEQQVESEWLEWVDVAQGDDREAQKHELGDMLFSLVEVGRRKGIKASEALDFATRRFLARFAVMEELASQAGKDLAAMSLDEKDELWNEAKKREAEQAR